MVSVRKMSHKVVVFLEENETAVVPVNWIEGENAWWPPFKTSTRITNAVIKREMPGCTWQKYAIKDIYTGTYENARFLLKKSEEGSDLQPEAELLAKRKTKPPRRLVMESSSESDSEVEEMQMLPPPPKKVVRLTAEKETPIQPPPKKVQHVVPDEETPKSPSPQPSTSRAETPQPSTSRAETPKVQKQAEARDVQVFTYLEKILEELGDHRRILKLLLNRSRQDAQEEEFTLPGNLQLPLASLEDVDSIETSLEDVQTSAKLVKYLSEFGGQTLKETVARVMRKVMTRDLAMKYNFTGQKGKLSFRNLKICTVIYKSVQKNNATRNTNRKEFEEIIKKWLVGARDREGGRKERVGRPDLEPEAQEGL